MLLFCFAFLGFQGKDFLRRKFHRWATKQGYYLLIYHKRCEVLPQQGTAQLTVSHLKVYKCVKVAAVKFIFLLKLNDF